MKLLAVVSDTPILQAEVDTVDQAISIVRSLSAVYGYTDEQIEPIIEQLPKVYMSPTPLHLYLGNKRWYWVLVESEPTEYAQRLFRSLQN